MSSVKNSMWHSGVVDCLSHVWLFATPWTAASPGSSVQKMFHARILEWAAIFFSGGSSLPGIEPASPALADGFFTTEPPEKPMWHSVLFSHPVVSGYLRPHGQQHTRPPCPSPSPEVCPSSCALHWWCHSAISSSDALFSFMDDCLVMVKELGQLNEARSRAV